MITLYELHWSHYCEKIRWALDFKKLSWKKVNINAFTKKEMKKYPCNEERRLVPFIYDEEYEKGVGDSSPILRYLEEAYPQEPLFPTDQTQKKALYKILIELDSKLGVIGRRLGYTQIILENPGILAELFLSGAWRGVLTWPIIRRISGALLGMMLIKRFRFELNESLNLYEELEKFLLPIVDKLKHQKYMFNDTFTAADLTLAVYLRPLVIIPFFREHPNLAMLFEWQEKLFCEHGREEKLLYETLIERHRQSHPPVRRKIRAYVDNMDFLKKVEHESKENVRAFNDHEAIWTWSILRVPYYYFFKIRSNKIQQRLASEGVR